MSLLIASSAGAGSLAVAPRLLGPYGEAAALGVMGLTLLAASHWLEPAGHAEVERRVGQGAPGHS